VAGGAENVDGVSLDAAGNTNNATFNEYLFFNGERVARRDSSNNVFYYFSDHLGTSREIVQAGQNTPCYDADFYPFGAEAVVATNTCSQNYKFTGKERDYESGLDNFGARFDSSGLGRFLSPDPVEITPGRLRDPQQLNLYSYVRNNPLRFVDPDGEILQLSGDVNEAQAQLCDLIGGDCSRISYNDKTNTITVDLTGIDLSQNEGASLINNLVSSSNVYSLALGDTVQTAGGPLSLSGDNSIANLDRNPDDRYSKGKTAKDLPAKGIDDQVGINPKDAIFRDSQGRLVPLSSLIFHELAEAYAKVDGGKAYGDFQSLGIVGGAIAIGLPQQGAHNEAVQRELTLRSQRPYMNFSGRAGDVLIRQPKPPKPQ
jgi:RHS repeat-associated protein